MAALTMDAGEVEGRFADVAAEVARTGLPVTVVRDGRPLVVIEPAKAEQDASRGPVDVAAAFMDEYEDVLGRLAR